MTLAHQIARCHHWYPQNYRPWFIGAQRHGWVTHNFAQTLLQYPDIFHQGTQGLELAPPLDSFAHRTAAVGELVHSLSDQGQLPPLRGEAFALKRQWHHPAVMTLDRAVAGAFGMRGYGVHLNGYVRRGRDLLIWVGKRSTDKVSSPGKLDHLVAGGQPFGLGLRENLTKEAEEEAAIPSEMIERAVSCGLLAYRCEREDGLRDDHIFCFDLELPENFIPQNQDGEVTGFELWPIAAVIERLRTTDDFKYNVALVLLHFIIRHGLLSPEDPEYTALVQGLAQHPENQSAQDIRNVKT